MSDNRKRIPLHFMLAWLVTTAILLLRSWQDITSPSLMFEDRFFLLPLYFNQHHVTDIFSEHLGYASVGPQLLAFLLGYLPLAWIPAAYAVTSLLLCSLAFSLFALPVFSALCANPLHRVFICLLMAILPLGRSLLVSNITYSEFNVLFILVLLVAVSRYRRPHWLLDWLVIPLCIASHPASITLIPLYLLNMYLGDRRQKLQQLGWLAITVLYVQFCVDHTSTEVLGVDYILFRFALAATAFAGKVMVEPWIGGHASASMFSEGNILDVGHSYIGNNVLVGTLFIACAAFFLFRYALKKSGRESIVYMILLTGFGILYLSVLTRLTGMGWHGHVQEPFLQRYAYVARLCTMVFLCCMISAWITQHPRWRKATGMLLAIITVLAIRSNGNNTRLYESAIAASTPLMQFLDSVETEIRQGNRACREHGDCTRTLEPDSRWPVVLDISTK